MIVGQGLHDYALRKMLKFRTARVVTLVRVLCRAPKIGSMTSLPARQNSRRGGRGAAQNCRERRSASHQH